MGLELAAKQGAEVSVVHVAPTVYVLPTAGFGLPVARPRPPTMRGRLALEEATALASSEGDAVSTELLIGNPVDEIVAHADSMDADLIVVGSRGHGAAPVLRPTSNMLMEAVPRRRASYRLPRPTRFGACRR